MTLRVVAHLTAKADRIDETREVLLSLVERTRAEQGCIVYELLGNKADPTDFTFVEEWTDEDALSAHLESDHIRNLVSKADDLLAAPSDIRRYTLLA
ncbi:MAG TPA: putative quinol monooxygenase [Pyrinomonadaceae bacterium]|nr:putative quinol monooxygenase [Pyrinomonadaceae bacterium]